MQKLMKQIAASTGDGAAAASGAPGGDDDDEDDVPDLVEDFEEVSESA